MPCYLVHAKYEPKLMEFSIKTTAKSLEIRAFSNFSDLVKTDLLFNILGCVFRNPSLKGLSNSGFDWLNLTYAFQK